MRLGLGGTVEDLFGWREEPKAKKTAPTWIREACQDWERGVGGLPSFVRIGVGLKELRQQYGWEQVRLAWQHYLKITPPHFASPQRFAATYAAWVLKPKVLSQPSRAFREILEGQRYRLIPDDAA